LLLFGKCRASKGNPNDATISSINTAVRGDIRKVLHRLRLISLEVGRSSCTCAGAVPALQSEDISFNIDDVEYGLLSRFI
jgi:hypothetical protein